MVSLRSSSATWRSWSDLRVLRSSGVLMRSSKGVFEATVTLCSLLTPYRLTGGSPNGVYWGLVRAHPHTHVHESLACTPFGQGGQFTRFPAQELLGIIDLYTWVALGVLPWRQGRIGRVF